MYKRQVAHLRGWANGIEILEERVHQELQALDNEGIVGAGDFRWPLLGKILATRAERASSHGLTDDEQEAALHLGVPRIALRLAAHRDRQEHEQDAHQREARADRQRIRPDHPGPPRPQQPLVGGGQSRCEILRP